MVSDTRRGSRIGRLWLHVCHSLLVHLYRSLVRGDCRPSDATGDAEQQIPAGTAIQRWELSLQTLDRRVDLEGNVIVYLDKPNSDNASCPRPPGRWGIQALWVVPLTSRTGPLGSAEWVPGAQRPTSFRHQDDADVLRKLFRPSDHCSKEG